MKKGSPFKVIELRCPVARYERYVLENNSTIEPETKQKAIGTNRVIGTQNATQMPQSAAERRIGASDCCVRKVNR